MVPIDPNTHTWEMKQCKKNGKSTPDTPLVTYRRMGVSKTEAVITTWHFGELFSRRMDCKHRRGRGRWPDCDGKRRGLVMSTCPTKGCMLFSLTIGGKPDSNTIAGFDPITNAWKEVSFLADGSQLIHLYSAKAADLLGDPADKVIKGKATFIPPMEVSRTPMLRSQLQTATTASTQPRTATSRTRSYRISRRTLNGRHNGQVEDAEPLMASAAVSGVDNAGMIGRRRMAGVDITLPPDQKGKVEGRE